MCWCKENTVIGEIDVSQKNDFLLKEAKSFLQSVFDLFSPKEGKKYPYILMFIELMINISVFFTDIVL